MAVDQEAIGVKDSNSLSLFGFKANVQKLVTFVRNRRNAKVQQIINDKKDEPEGGYFTIGTDGKVQFPNNYPENKDQNQDLKDAARTLGDSQIILAGEKAKFTEMEFNQAGDTAAQKALIEDGINKTLDKLGISDPEEKQQWAAMIYKIGVHTSAGKVSAEKEALIRKPKVKPVFGPNGNTIFRTFDASSKIQHTEMTINENGTISSTFSAPAASKKTTTSDDKISVDNAQFTYSISTESNVHTGALTRTSAITRNPSSNLGLADVNLGVSIQNSLGSQYDGISDLFLSFDAQMMDIQNKNVADGSTLILDPNTFTFDATKAAIWDPANGALVPDKAVQIPQSSVSGVYFSPSN